MPTKILTVRFTLGCIALALSPSLVSGARPNVLVAISDDQSYPHASAYGQPVIKTPGFDEIARRGILFNNAFTPCPGCSPMRAAFLTGRHIWQNREAGTHASHFPSDLRCFTGQLAAAGYRVGYTGKPWGPGKFDVSGWTQNPVGKSYSSIKMKSPQGISGTDYAANFAAFLDTKADDEPFCFWFGGHEPHRSFGKGLGKQAGMNPDDVIVPGFLPDCDEIRSDLCDYFNEIQWFDAHLVRMIDLLKQKGFFENTLIIVTSDNGMAFPRAKANLYEYGIHMPLAISWPDGMRHEGRECNELVSLIDVTATIVDACEVEVEDNHQVTGTTLRDIIKHASPVERAAVFAGRERHSSSRYNSLGYPCRCVRTANFLYIRNFYPERWPAGTPRKYSQATFDENNQLVNAKLGPEHGGYHDIDACPSLSWMISHRMDASVKELFSLAVDKRPPEEFYDIRSDSACLNNLVNSQQHTRQLDLHRKLLMDELKQTGDARVIDADGGHVWETYPRYSSLRWFPKPDWAEAEPDTVPSQAWLDARRPKQGRRNSK